MSIYKTFRDYSKSKREAGRNSLSARFDQPTYISFKLIFANSWERDQWYNGAGNDYVGGLNYDRMPHPLFMEKGADGIEDRQRYSAVDYLLDANEFTRAQMLEEFQYKWLKLQDNFQWYFQKIEGVEELLKIDPKKGIRVPEDKRLTITSLEGIDLRMSHLLNMYRKIAWDDVYQRWILPDMMRYFTLKIYISEFRQFHTINQFDGWGVADETYKNDGELNLKLLDDILPTWIINCEMCEFDLEGLEFDYLQNLGVGEEPEQAGVKFKIKVGKIYEEQTYPVFQNMYLYDKKLNGFDRSKIEDIVSTPIYGEGPALLPGTKGKQIILKTENTSIPYNSTTQSSDAEWNPHSTILGIAQNHPMNFTDWQKSTHISGRSFNQMENDDTMFGEKWNTNAQGFGGNTLQSHRRQWSEESADSTKPETWWNNAVDFGTAFGKNLGNKIIDKAKLTEIPGLGISFVEAQAALESKDIITALGIIRKGVTTVANDYVTPSERLEGKIVDGLFQTYLEGIVASEATENNQKIQEAANLALSDKGTWDKIKDYSLATDLVSQGEINTINKIKEGTLYRNITEEATGGDKSLATDMVGKGESNVPKTVSKQILYEGVPTSQATSGQILKG